MKDEWIEKALAAADADGTTFSMAFFVNSAKRAEAIRGAKAILRAALSAVEAEIRAEAEHSWKLIVAGGEDAPGAASKVTLADAEKMLDGDRREIGRLQDERDCYREALEAFMSDWLDNWKNATPEERGSGFENTGTPVSGSVFIKARQALKGEA